MDLNFMAIILMGETRSHEEITVKRIRRGGFLNRNEKLPDSKKAKYNPKIRIVFDGVFKPLK